jgi:PAS domain S-box-containing protein
VTIREAAGDLGASPDVPAIHRITLDAARELLGPHLRYVAWIGINDRGAMYPAEIVGPDGPIERADAGIDDALQQIDVIGERPTRLVDNRGDDVVIVPIPCRISSRAGLVVASSQPVPEEVDESLAILGTQVALALDALVQSEELHEKRSEARFQQLVRHSSDAVMIIGRDGRIRYQTPSVVRVLGYLAVDLDGAAFEGVIHPDALDHVAGFIEHLVQGSPETVAQHFAPFVRVAGSGHAKRSREIL